MKALLQRLARQETVSEADFQALVREAERSGYRIRNPFDLQAVVAKIRSIIDESGFPLEVPVIQIEVSDRPHPGWGGTHSVFYLKCKYRVPRPLRRLTSRGHVRHIDLWDVETLEKLEEFDPEEMVDKLLRGIIEKVLSPDFWSDHNMDGPDDECLRAIQEWCGGGEES